MRKICGQRGIYSMSILEVNTVFSQIGLNTGPAQPNTILRNYCSWRWPLQRHQSGTTGVSCAGSLGRSSGEEGLLLLNTRQYAEHGKIANLKKKSPIV